MTAVLGTGCAQRETVDWEGTYASLDSSRLLEDAQAVVDCLGDSGFPGYTATADGGVLSPGFGSDEFARAEEAYGECAESVGGVLKPITSGPTDDQLDLLYHLEREAATCLASHGYRVAEAPPMELYVQTFGTDRHWGAWSSLASQLDPSDVGSLGASCPDPMWFLADLPARVML
jgi:hypothetical protein